MKEIIRSTPQFSQCGLNCGLCPRFHTEGTSRCPGCYGEGFMQKRPSCGVVTCAQRHGGVSHCCFCEEYPCAKLQNAACVDSFITHRPMQLDMARAKAEGIDAYLAGLDEKMAMLTELLAHYNDGRRKSLYCLAINLLALQDARTVMAQIRAEIPLDVQPKERAAKAVALLEAMAKAKGISLKLRKKGE